MLKFLKRLFEKKEEKILEHPLEESFIEKDKKVFKRVLNGVAKNGLKLDCQRSNFVSEKVGEDRYYIEIDIDAVLGMGIVKTNNGLTYQKVINLVGNRLKNILKEKNVRKRFLVKIVYTRNFFNSIKSNAGTYLLSNSRFFKIEDNLTGPMIPSSTDPKSDYKRWSYTKDKCLEMKSTLKKALTE